MIKKWNIENFKSVNKTSLEFAPLTIFAGANSSGKSTIIQSLLLTTQTIQSQVQSRPVVLNGHILRLGTFNDILYNLAISPKISIGFELIPSFKLDSHQISSQRVYRYYNSETLEAVKSISCNFCFSASGTEAEKDILQLQPRIESSSIKTQGILDEKEFDEIIEVIRSKEDPSTRLKSLDMHPDPKFDLTGLEYEVVSRQVFTRQYQRRFGSPKTGSYVGSILQHFLPSRFVLKYDKIEEQSRQIIDYIFNIERSSFTEMSHKQLPPLTNEFMQIIIGMLEETISATSKIDPTNKKNETTNLLYENLRKDFTFENLRRVNQSMAIQTRLELFTRIGEKRTELIKMLKGNRNPEYNFAYMPLPDYSEAANEYVQNFFANNLKYLGPLRDEPKPVYPLAGSVDPKDIGFKGENTAAVLEVHRKTLIPYVPCSGFLTLDKALPIKVVPLSEAVLDWLNYLGVAHEISTFDKGKLGHELKVSTQGSESLHDLTHVGVGVSQVLPILVQSLLSESGSTLVFEQPELHLHPKVQTRLADFFVSMTVLGKQCIIETHSEYLINRLRYMSAITNSDDISKNVILYFVEKEKGYSNFRPIRINKYGVIEDWPIGFFDENEDNATETLKAGMQKRLAEKNKLL